MPTPSTDASPTESTVASPDTVPALLQSDEAPAEVAAVLDYAAGSGGGCSGDESTELAFDPSMAAANPKVVSVLDDAVLCLLGTAGPTEVVVESPAGELVTFEIDLDDSYPYAYDLRFQPFVDGDVIVSVLGAQELRPSDAGTFLLTATSEGATARTAVAVRPATTPALSARGPSSFDGSVEITAGEDLIVQGAGFEAGARTDVTFYRHAGAPFWDFVTLQSVTADAEGTFELDLGSATAAMEGCYLAEVPASTPHPTEPPGDGADPTGPLARFCVVP